MAKYNYSVFLHKKDTNPKDGFGYWYCQITEVAKRCNEWNSYTRETCPHKGFLNGEQCKLCGNEYQVSYCLLPAVDKITINL